MYNISIITGKFMVNDVPASDIRFQPLDRMRDFGFTCKKIEEKLMLSTVFKIVGT